jgi:hypothetical protein
MPGGALEQSDHPSMTSISSLCRMTVAVNQVALTQHASLITREIPRLCRGGSKSLAVPAVTPQDLCRALRWKAVADGQPGVTLNQAGRPERVGQDERKVAERQFM